MRGSSSFTFRLLSIALGIVAIFVLFVGLHNARAAGATVSEHLTEQAKQYASRQSQGVFSFHKFFNSTRFSHHKSPSKDSESSTVSKDSGATSMWTNGNERKPPTETQSEPPRRQAKRISPKELMSRPLPVDRTRAPKLLHQSWKTESLPAKFQRWSSTCRRKNPDYEYVLWTDKDNKEIVKKYAPWFIDTYKELQSEIYRVDAMRNIYMHIFGGVYADLDTECIRPYDTMFEHYNVSSAPYMDLQQIAPFNETSPRTTRTAFLGRMGTDEESEHSIPNAWMASTAGHPFWLLTTERIRNHLHDGGTPEQITGPVSLRDQVNEYYKKYHGEDSLSLDDHHAKSPWAKFYPPEHLETLIVLPFWAIYPYSWQRDGDAYKDHCLVGQSKFNASRCKQVIGVRAWGTWSVTYWSHSWNMNGGENVDNLMSDAQKAKLKLQEEKKERAKEREKKKLEKQQKADVKVAENMVSGGALAKTKHKLLKALDEMEPGKKEAEEKLETGWDDDEYMGPEDEELPEERPVEPEDNYDDIDDEGFGEPEDKNKLEEDVEKPKTAAEEDFDKPEKESSDSSPDPESVTGGDEAIEESSNFNAPTDQDKLPEAPDPQPVSQDTNEGMDAARENNEWRKEFDQAFPDAQTPPESPPVRRRRRNLR